MLLLILWGDEHLCGAGESSTSLPAAQRRLYLPDGPLMCQTLDRCMGWGLAVVVRRPSQLDVVLIEGVYIFIRDMVHGRR